MMVDENSGSGSDSSGKRKSSSFSVSIVGSYVLFLLLKQKQACSYYNPSYPSNYPSFLLFVRVTCFCYTALSYYTALSGRVCPSFCSGGGSSSISNAASSATIRRPPTLTPGSISRRGARSMVCISLLQIPSLFFFVSSQ